VPYHQL
jgi:transposase InsO family protein